jgi:hypothetical protein
MDLRHRLWRVAAIDEDWLASLPVDEEVVTGPSETIRFNALLVSAPVGRVRLLVWPLFLEFNAADVKKIEELTVPPEDLPQGAIAVDVALPVRAPVMAIFPAEMVPSATLGGQVPFSLATRPTALMLPQSPEYTAALAKYLQRYGFEPET